MPAVQTAFDWSPSADIHETKDGYVIEAHLPGVKRENTKIDVDRNVLTIRGERKDERENKNDETKYWQKESSYGTFMRRFTLPDEVDPKKIKASFKDGVLNLTIPKSPEAEAVTIPIEEDTGKQEGK